MNKELILKLIEEYTEERHTEKFADWRASYSCDHYERDMQESVTARLKADDLLEQIKAELDKEQIMFQIFEFLKSLGFNVQLTQGGIKINRDEIANHYPKESENDAGELLVMEIQDHFNFYLSLVHGDDNYNLLQVRKAAA